MSNTIQPSYGTTAYSSPTKTRETKQSGTQASSFLGMAAQASGRKTDTLTTSIGGLMGMAGLPANKSTALYRFRYRAVLTSSIRCSP